MPPTPSNFALRWVALYDDIGEGYAKTRQPDPRIERVLWDALGEGSCVNVGAGAGSYEPRSTRLAIERSPLMASQRRADAAPVVIASAEALPLADNSFETALAVLTIHHWPERARTGLRELCRVTRGRVVLLTWDPEAVPFWLTRDYFPEIVEIDLPIFPTISELGAELGGSVTSEPLPIPHDCVDGFLGAFWRRPAVYLDPAIRNGISSFCKLPAETVERGIERLREDLASGAWETRNADLLNVDALDVGYRVVRVDYR